MPYNVVRVSFSPATRTTERVNVAQFVKLAPAKRTADARNESGSHLDFKGDEPIVSFIVERG